MANIHLRIDLTLSTLGKDGGRALTTYMTVGAGSSHVNLRIVHERITDQQVEVPGRSVWAMTETPVPRLTRRSLFAAAGGLALVSLVGCSDDSESDAKPGPSPTATSDPDVTSVATSIVPALQVYDAPGDLDTPGGEGAEAMVLNRGDEASGEVVLLALEVGSAWLHVQLPVRPNGTTGYVRARDVRLSNHSFAMEIALTDHELVVTQAGEEVLRTPVGVGRTDRPTPGGDYYIKELLQPPDPNGVYGPYAYGLSGYSNVLTEFAGGEGVIGVHGTNEPELVGSDASSGCIRLPNEQITALVETIGLPLGTPVTIRA
ncbi:L,D-transpeptidase family protein [Aeromicrobium sp.]|uniref:L,D-transpeptidase n=1 Tax=Aeromicrobium sp. TaxID=1871063 RepID=UPI0025BEAE36|nr:L,D-transpeptidase family protein [Aeromicrobium sp.]MCK5890062.1 L,D-transpeptidase family protein [Aeromicrobium sp.]